MYACRELERVVVRKYYELENGCMAKAGLNEMTFVLLARDKSAPVAIRAWIRDRIDTGKNKFDDEQIQEAELCALTMEQEQERSK